VTEGFRGVLSSIWRRFEIILVVNASSDPTYDVCARLAERHPDEIRVSTVDEPGWGRAVRAGLAEARGDMLCYTNSARTTPQILAMVHAYARAYPDNVVKANRRVRDSFARRAGSLLYNVEARALFDLPIWDINGTPKVFARKHGALLELRSDGDLLDLEFIVTCVDNGYPILEVPLLETVRHGGRSTTNVASAWRMYTGALKMRRSR
jgi:glycosyltransferase involved in cell wall biosynthesis